MATTAVQTSQPSTIDRDLAGASQGPLADPGAWAVIAFATTSFMLGVYNTHLIGQGSLPIVFPVAFFFGGLIQILVGLLEIGRGNVFGAVVFGSYGPFWVIFGAIQVWFAKMATPSSVDAGVALFLAMWAVLTFFFLIASLRTDWVLVAVFALIFVGLVLLAIGFQSGSVTWIKAGGWVTIAFAILAWYHAAADVINFTFGRRLLSVGRIPK
ncbi:MAG TPA: acetate uptake transporter [Solirubrobacteraceae bacterium]|nr:acetate uptake transporter [Solirubrobacteraceae bacterium]